MQLKRINSAIDRIGRNDINENFDILERGYGKSALDAQTAKEQSLLAKEQSLLAKEQSEHAIETSDEAKQQAESVQTQFNQVVVEGDSSVEAAQARVDTENIAHETLKVRIDNDVIKINQNLAQIESLENFEVSSRQRRQQAIVTFTLDDGNRHDYLTILPILLRYGLIATTGVVTKHVGVLGYSMVWSQIKELQDVYGWEIASHSGTHVDLTSLSDEDLVLELEGSLRDLKAQNLKARNLFLPYGRLNDKVKEFAKRYYRSMRVSGAASTGKRLNYSPFDMYRVDSVFFGDTTGAGNSVDTLSGFETDTVDYIKWHIDKAIAENTWLCIGVHGGNIVDFSRQADFELICEYIASKMADGQIKNMTYNDALNHVGNVIDTDDFKVGTEGKIDGRYGKLQMAAQNEFLGTTPIRIFDENYITVNSITRGYPEGTPSAGGMLTTLKYDGELLRAYQIFAELDGQGLYYQGFNSDGIAQGWRRLDADRVKVFTNTLPSNHTIADIERGAISYYTIPTANATGYPSNAPGVLVADRISAQNDGCYEEYRLTNSRGVYTRKWVTTQNAWTPWELNEPVKVFATALPSTHTLGDLEQNRISYYTIPTANATGYPLNTPGVLIADRASTQNGGCYEEYRLINSKGVYTRKWDNSANAWTPWELDMKITKSVVNNYTLTSAIISYPLGISYTLIQRSHAETHGFPESVGGTLETHNVLDAGWVYQYYHLYNSAKTYKRVFKNDNTWSEFVLFGGGN